MLAGLDLGIGVDPISGNVTLVAREDETMSVKKDRVQAVGPPVKPELLTASLIQNSMMEVKS